jgi:hypothetical protein
MTSIQEGKETSRKFIEEHVGKDGVLIEDGKPDAVSMLCDTEEGRGTVALERSGYGGWIWVNGACMGHVDTFYMHPGENPAPDERCIQIVINDPAKDDTLMLVRLYRDRTEAFDAHLGKVVWMRYADNSALFGDNDEA